MSFDDLLIAIIGGGVGLSGAYLRAEYAVRGLRCNSHVIARVEIHNAEYEVGAVRRRAIELAEGHRMVLQREPGADQTA